MQDLQNNDAKVVPDKEDDHEERQNKDTLVLRNHITGTCNIANLRVDARRLLDQTYLDQDGLAPDNLPPGLFFTEGVCSEFLTW